MATTKKKATAPKKQTETLYVVLFQDCGTWVSESAYSRREEALARAEDLLTGGCVTDALGNNLGEEGVYIAKLELPKFKRETKKYTFNVHKG